MHSCISANAFPLTISVLRLESIFPRLFCIHVSVAQNVLPGGSQAHRGTLLFYCGLGQAQILYVDSTWKTCGGVKSSVSYYKKTDPWCYHLVSTIWFWDCSSPDDSFFGICSHQKPNDHTNRGLELTIMFSPLRILKTLSRATCTSSLASDPRLTLKLPPPLTPPLSTQNLTTVTPSFV